MRDGSESKIYDICSLIVKGCRLEHLGKMKAARKFELISRSMRSKELTIRFVVKLKRIFALCVDLVDQRLSQYFFGLVIRS